MLLDELAQHFGKIYFFASKSPLDSSLYQDGESVYSYRIMAHNVELIELASSDQRTVIGKGIRVFLNLAHLCKYIKYSELSYIFMPGYSGVASCLISLIFKTPYILYFGSVWDKTAQFRLQRNRINALLFPTYKRLYAKMEKPVIKRARMCIVAGKGLYNMIWPLNQDTFETVPMTPFQADISSYQGSRDISRRVNLIFVGPINKGKGIVYLLRAIDLIEQADIRVFLNLAGSLHRKYQRELDNLIVEFSLDEKVRFLGYISTSETLQKLYQESDVLVTPSLGEGFPRVIYEAMIMGLPVVASDLNSIRENLAGEDLVSLVPPKDPQAIADAVIELCRNKELRKQRIVHGKAFAEKKLRGNPAEQLIQLLKEHDLY